MAQGGSVEGPMGASDTAPRKLTDQEAYQMQQYEKIVRFRNAVFSGAHPTIKPPNSPARPPPGPAIAAVQMSQGNGAPQGSLPSSRRTVANGQDAAHVNLPRGIASASSVVPRPLASGQTEINPILLEKSDELIRAELDLQRKRLERALRDEVEQRRFAKPSQPECYPDVDISDVLARALTLVPQTAATSPVGEDLTANQDAASDSFDEKTFYSSRHDTPQSQMMSRVHNDSVEPQGSATAARQQTGSASQAVDDTQHQRPQAVSAPKPPTSIPKQPRDSQHGLPVKPVAAANVVPGLNNYIGTGTVATPPSQNTTSAAQSQSGDSANLEHDPARAEAARSRMRLQRNSYVNLHPPSPLIRGHALQPVAPQPAQISPLAAPGQGQGGPSPAVLRTRGTPAQVAALRQEPSAATSPDSSSQGGRLSEKKKGKKKKRKADRQAPEVEAHPDIKVEPRSPSPLNAPSYVRANKRQRQSQGQVIELDYEPSYERSLQGSDGQYLTRQYRDARVPLGYDSGRAYPQRAVSTALIGDQRYGREYLDERRLPGPAPPYPYSPRTAYPPRPVSQMFAGDGYREPPRPFREYTEGGGMGVRPEGDAYVGQPNPAQPRMLVDAYGREYFDPSHPAVQRSAAPSAGPGEPGLVYERLPPRAVSRHPGLEPYGEGGVVYGGAPAAYAMPRRIVTQPAGYAPYDYRDATHRDYQPQSMAPPADFMEVAGPSDRRTMNEAATGYATRAASMMPVEAVRYEVPQAYGRMQSVRPDIPGQEYAPGVRSEGRREAAQPYMREYAARPLEPYHRPVARGTDEIAFIERPRDATQEIVYADDGRREVYR